jgi:hypothetical protein
MQQMTTFYKDWWKVYEKDAFFTPVLDYISPMLTKPAISSTDHASS